MRKIKLSDIIDIAEYERRRNDYRSKIMIEKDKRRIHVGPKITYLFETFDTMVYQVQEMMRAERIVAEEAIMEEINTYNELVPNANQLSASMFIEISDVEGRKDFLTKIVTLPDHTYLLVNDEKIMAEFDPRQGSDDKLSSVQYIKFSLSEMQAEQFNKSDSRIVFGFDHDEYNFEHEINDETKSIFSNDFKLK